MQSKKTVQLNELTILSWMKRIIKSTKKFSSTGEVPVAAIILDEIGHCIGYGENTRNKNNDPLGHAELNALKQASFIKNDWRFNECTLIVNLEPCQMCAGALIQARMGRVIFGASDYKRGGLGGTIDLSKHKSAHHKMIVTKGILSTEIEQEISKWFKNMRNQRTIKP